MHTFVTVGSTKFDSLVAEALSSRTLSILKAQGYTTMTVQCGNSSFAHASLVAKGETATLSLEGVLVELWKFKPSLREEYEKADLIISHAGQKGINEKFVAPTLTAHRLRNDNRDTSSTETADRHTQSNVASQSSGGTSASLGGARLPQIEHNRVPSILRIKTSADHKQ